MPETHKTIVFHIRNFTQAVGSGELTEQEPVIDYIPSGDNDVDESQPE